MLPFYLPMPIQTVKSSSLGRMIDDLSVVDDFCRHGSGTAIRLPVPDATLAALPPGRC